MKLFYILLIIILFNFTNNKLFAFSKNSHPIKLAIFDNPQPDPSRLNSKENFTSSYIAGINTAIYTAKRKNISIIYKEFFHESNLSSMIQQASDAKAWNPDVILGLSTSNDFLMSKAFFGDQVVISISATDSAISSLPDGFYSIGIPDKDTIDATIKFIDQHYHHPNLFITTAAESKESVDFAHVLATKYQENYKNSKVIEKKFLTDDLNNIDFSKFMREYHKNDVIVVMSIGYDSAIELMNKITSHINPTKPIFITPTDN